MPKKSPSSIVAFIPITGNGYEPTCVVLSLIYINIYTYIDEKSGSKDLVSIQILADAVKLESASV